MNTHTRRSPMPILPPVPPRAQRLAQARRLPAPTPGQVVKVPLALWPIYQELHGIEPAGYRHPYLLVQHMEES